MNEVAIVLEIISSLSSTLALDDILAQVTEKTAQIVEADSCAISHWDRDNDTIIALADYIAPEINLPPKNISDIGLAYPLADYPATKRVLEQFTPLIIHINDPTADEAEKALLCSFEWGSALMVPMLYKGQATGLMELYLDQGRADCFTEKKIKLCQALANHAAIVIENARLFSTLKAQRKSLRQMTLRVINAQEEERRRLAQELHDEFGQLLTALRVNLDMTRQALPAEASTELYDNINEADRLAVQLQEAARNLSRNLRPAILDDLGLVPALHWEVNNYEQRTAQSVHFEADLGQTRLPPELEITVYRIISEALTNVARHAEAAHVWIYLAVKAQHLVVGIEDDGVGFEAAHWFEPPVDQQHLGLTGMRERAELLSGQFQICSKPGAGTKIQVKFPLKT